MFGVWKCQQKLLTHVGKTHEQELFKIRDFKVHQFFNNLYAQACNLLVINFNTS